MDIVKELNKLSAEEFERVISKLLSEDREKAVSLAKAIGKAMEREIREEKLRTEMAIAQSRIYTLTRDVEEIAILKEAVENVLGAKFYKNPEESEGVRRIAEEFGVGALQLGADLKRLLSPFSTTEAMDWVFKMLRNQTVVVSKPIDEHDVIFEEYPITVSKPFIYRDKEGGTEARTHYVGVLASLDGRTRFIPVYTVVLRTTPEDKDYQVFIEDTRVDYLTIRELAEFQRRLPQLGYSLSEFDEEVAKQIKSELATKLIDKFVFFNKAIPSSKLNEELRRFFKEHGFFTPRKNQSVFIADKDEKEALFFSQVKYFRAIVKTIHDVYAETKRLISEAKGRDYGFPSLEKQLSLARQILIEEVALLSKEQIVEQLKEQFEIGLEKLKELVSKGVSYDKLKNQHWFRELELIPRKVDIEEEKVREFKLIKKKLEMQFVYDSVMKNLSWEKPQVGKFNKALTTLLKYKNNQDLLLSVREQLRKALVQLTNSVKKTKEINSLVSTLIMNKEILEGFENEITEFAKKIYTANPNLSKSLAKAFNIPEDKYKPVGIGIFRRKFR